VAVEDGRHEEEAIDTAVVIHAKARRAAIREKGSLSRVVI